MFRHHFRAAHRLLEMKSLTGIASDVAKSTPAGIKSLFRSNFEPTPAGIPQKSCGAVSRWRSCLRHAETAPIWRGAVAATRRKNGLAVCGLNEAEYSEKPLVSILSCSTGTCGNLYGGRRHLTIRKKKGQWKFLLFMFLLPVKRKWSGGDGGRDPSPSASRYTQKRSAT